MGFQFITIRLKVLVGYFDPNRFPFRVVGRLQCSRFGTGGTICSLAQLRIQELKSVTECQSLGVRLFGCVGRIIIATRKVEGEVIRPNFML